MREDEPIEELPPSLVDALKAADRSVPMITARVDREVAAMARAHFAARERRPRFLLRHAGIAVAASVLLAVAVLQWPLRDTPRDPPWSDVDGSGRIDIADVLALARTSKPGERTQAELDAFARRIVAVTPERGDAS